MDIRSPRLLAAVLVFCLAQAPTFPANLAGDAVQGLGRSAEQPVRPTIGLALSGGGANTMVGPIYFAWGKGDGGRSGYFLSVGSGF